MEKIASFKVDHTKLKRGVYLSREDMIYTSKYECEKGCSAVSIREGDQDQSNNFTKIQTWDLRMYKPNCGTWIDPAAAHTLEHLFATVVRTLGGNRIIYCGPMGCMTGFYLITQHLNFTEVVSLLQEAFKKISEWNDPIPGATTIECGNAKFQNSYEAIKEAKEFLQVLQNLPPECPNYLV